LPSLSASGGYTYNEFPAVIPSNPVTGTGDLVIIPRDQLDVTAKVELPLLDAQRWFTAAAAAASVDAAQAREGATLDTVRRQVVAAFYTVTGARAVLDSAQKSLKVAQAQLEFAAARRAAGVATELELERARAEVERNQQLVADAESLVATSARSLRTLTGLEPGALPALPDDDLHPEPPEEELERRVEGLPPVVAAERDVSAAGRARTAATLALVPSVNAQFTQRLTNATSFQGTPHSFNAGLTLSWRLDVPVVQTIRAQASAEESARLQAEKARLAAQDQVHADWQKVRAAITKVKASAAQVAAARRAQALATERYQAGVATQLDTIQTDRDVFAAEVNDIQARGELAAARLALRLSAGLPLEVQP